MKTRLIALIAILTLVLVGCGSEDPLPAAAETSPSPSASPGHAPAEPEDTRDPEPQDEGEETGQIVVRRPSAGDRVASPLVIAGDADVFEATVSLRLVTADGRVLAEDFTTATCGSGCRGDYRTRLKFDVAETTDGILEVFESSAEDGSALHMVRVPLTLLP